VVQFEEAAGFGGGRAYELYVLRGNQSGSELDDWFQAKEEILRAQEESMNDVDRKLPLRHVTIRRGWRIHLPNVAVLVETS
jgi:Protein of unknown function (DUF2934)